MGISHAVNGECISGRWSKRINVYTCMHQILYIIIIMWTQCAGINVGTCAFNPDIQLVLAASTESCWLLHSQGIGVLCLDLLKSAVHTLGMLSI